MKSLLLVAVVLIIGVSTPATQADDELREVIQDEHALGADFWIYNDLEAAREEARRLNRPILVTFRCVPCKACSGFDAEVAKGSDKIAELAREHFVSVRQVEMKGVDLTQFQFDHDLNWAAMFINADGTVYARYGTQSAEGADAYNSTESLAKTMSRVVELHKKYPGNAEQLAGKRAKPKPYVTALEMPGMENKDRLRAATTRKNCIHCHMIHDAENRHAQSTGKFSQDLLWRYPLPDNLGLRIDPRDGIKIARVEEDSPAARGGLQTGEDVLEMNGQPITSIADMQWVLHNLSNGSETVEVRGSESGRTKLTLAPGWKRTDISWRGSLWSVQPMLRVWTPELSEEERRSRGIPDEQSALLVKWINTGSPGGRAARDSGLREGDVIVEVEGKPFLMSPAQFNLHLKLNYEVGDTFPVTVLRGGERKALKLRLVE